MMTTRKNKYGKFKVAVLNPTIVPTHMDIVIGSRFLELQFEVEPFEPTDGVQHFSRNNGNNGDDRGAEDRAEEMDDTYKKHKTGGDPKSKYSDLLYISMIKTMKLRMVKCKKILISGKMTCWMMKGSA